MTADGLVNIFLVLVALALIVWARPLSIRYNGWTTRLRERHPSFNPPPTPEWRERNTRIMTNVFRIVGIVFLIRVALGLLSKSH